MKIGIQKQGIKICLTIACSVTLLLGCVSDKFSEKERDQPLLTQQQPIDQHSRSYLRISKTNKQTITTTVSYVGVISLANALRRFAPDYFVVPLDSNVDLTQKISLNALDMPFFQFLDTLAVHTNLDIQLDQQRIELRSFLSKEWMLGALSGGKSIRLSSNAAMNKGLDEESESAALVENVSFDEWDQLVDSAKAILQVDQASSGLKPYVYGSRSIGRIVAGGGVEPMRRLDAYLSGLEKASTQQVAIEVQAFDVMLTDERGSGVNWQAFAALGSSLNGNPVSASITNTSTGGGFIPNAINPEGLWQGQAGYQSSSFSGQAVVQFLSRYGQVELLNQPNLTVRNGGFAIMHAGEQLSYIAQTEVVRESDSETVAVSASVKQLKVGVSLAVSPKLLADNRILLNIWPVVSSVQGFDEFYSDPIPVKVPRLALQELSTEVIVESGKTIQLGGLIRKSVTESLQTLPFRDGITGALLKPFFHADSKKLERRELVILVTPRLITHGE